MWSEYISHFLLIDIDFCIQWVTVVVLGVGSRVEVYYLCKIFELYVHIWLSMNSSASQCSLFVVVISHSSDFDCVYLISKD